MTEDRQRVWRMAYGTWHLLTHPPYAVRHLLFATALAGCTNAQAARTPFALRGVIEGFYGTPWSHQDRLDVLRFMGRVGMNAYVYAPKDDPYHRERWRDPYPAAQLEQLRELVDVATANDVAFHYAISPGLSMVYADRGDLRALERKLDQVAAIGVGHFALFLDDVPYELHHAADRERFGRLADAHAHVIGHAWSYLVARDGRLSVTPTTYTGAWGDREYLRRLGQLVSPDVPFFWTGPDVASHTITVQDAAAWRELIGGRPLLVWDNYPVNDYARWRLFLGPLRHRDPQLATAVSGMLANPMNEAHASMLPLATVADYAADPEGYDPDASLARAIDVLYGRHAAPHVRALLRVYGDYWWDGNVFRPLVVPGLPVDTRGIGAALSALDSALSGLRAAEAAGDTSVAKLIPELAPMVSAAHGRLQDLARRPAFQREGDTLRYYLAEQHIRAAAARAAPVVDGRLDEWSTAMWRSLRRAERPDDGAAAQFTTWGDTLFVAVRVRDSRPGGQPGNRAGEADHVALVVDLGPEPPALHIDAGDLVILTPAPSASAPSEGLVAALDFTGLIANNVSARSPFRFTEFFMTSVRTTPQGPAADVAPGVRSVSRRTERGYAVEVAIPFSGSLRVAIVVGDLTERGWVFRSLSAQNYPGNPATFVRIDRIE